MIQSKQQCEHLQTSSKGLIVALSYWLRVPNKVTRTWLSAALLLHTGYAFKAIVGRRRVSIGMLRQIRVEPSEGSPEHKLLLHYRYR